jgi:hypothetical protein
VASPSPEPSYSRKPATTAPTTHRDDDGSTRMLNYPHRLSLGAAHLHLTAQLVLLIYLGSLQGDTVKPAERGPCRTVDPGRRRHDTPAFGMPAGRKLPAVTQKQELPTTSQTPKAPWHWTGTWGTSFYRGESHGFSSSQSGRGPTDTEALRDRREKPADAPGRRRTLLKAEQHGIRFRR